MSESEIMFPKTRKKPTKRKAIVRKEAKPKKCGSPNCDKLFKPVRTGQKTCYNFKCALGYAGHVEAKKAKKQNAAEKKAYYAKHKPTQEKLAQQAFSAYIRERDANLPCISCQRNHSGQYHAGHYLSRGAHPALRFDEDNCHKQCAPCNNHLSGNIASYRINLIKKIGVERVERLEGPHEPAKYTLEDLIDVKEKYKRMTKELKLGKVE